MMESPPQQRKSIVGEMIVGGTFASLDDRLAEVCLFDTFRLNMEMTTAEWESSAAEKRRGDWKRDWNVGHRKKRRNAAHSKR